MPILVGSRGQGRGQGRGRGKDLNYDNSSMISRPGSMVRPLLQHTLQRHEMYNQHQWVGSSPQLPRQNSPFPQRQQQYRPASPHQGQQRHQQRHQHQAPMYNEQYQGTRSYQTSPYQQRQRYQQTLPQPQHASQEIQELKLDTNYFTVQTRDDWTLHAYHVQYDPEINSDKLKCRYLDEHEDVTGRIKVFDGGMLYLPAPLPEEETVLKFLLSNNEHGTITLQEAGECRADCEQNYQIYNIIFKNVLAASGMTRIGRDYFNVKNAKHITDYGIDILQGISTSITPCEGGMKLLVDLTHKVVWQDTVYDYMLGLRDQCYRQRQEHEFNQMCVNNIVGKVVITRYNNRTYTVTDIDFDSCPTNEITTDQHGTISYIQYMKQQCNMKVTDFYQPMLMVKQSKVKSENIIRLVPECCHLTDYPEDMKNNYAAMKSVSAYAKPDPQVRKRTMYDIISIIKSTPEAAAMLQSWNMNISPSCDTISAELLPTETIYLGNGQQVQYERKRGWTSEVRNKKPAVIDQHLDRWLLLHHNAGGDRICTVVWDLVKGMQDVCRPMGVRVAQPNVVSVGRGQTLDYTNTLRREISASGACYQLVMCVIPTDRGDLYKAVKKICNVEYAIPAQMVVAKTLLQAKNFKSTCTTLAKLSIVKIGVQLWHIKIPVEGMMVVGMDTNHDSTPGGRSVNAFVASLNHHATQYYSNAVYTGRYGEIFNYLKDNMKKAIQAYQKRNHFLPKHILIYRDGVGDGNIRNVQRKELPQVKEACKEFGTDYAPTVTCVLIQKRIDTRFSVSSTHNKYNTTTVSDPPPGTVVTSDVTRPDVEDFFMVTHTARQGSVAPKHCVIIANDWAQLDRSTLTQLTYKLCHLNYNFAHTCTLPVPCFYAHKLSEFVGERLHSVPNTALAETLYYL